MGKHPSQSFMCYEFMSLSVHCFVLETYTIDVSQGSYITEIKQWQAAARTTLG